MALLVRAMLAACALLPENQNILRVDEGQNDSVAIMSKAANVEVPPNEVPRASSASVLARDNSAESRMRGPRQRGAAEGSVIGTQSNHAGHNHGRRKSSAKWQRLWIIRLPPLQT